MKINRDNYEMYLIDYFDGKLDAVEASELLLFIEQNPAYKKEFELLNDSIPAAEKDNETIDTSFLKKPVYSDVKNHFEEKLIAHLEGDMNQHEKFDLEKSFIIYPELKTDVELFAKTKLSPDKKMVFENKSILKKNIPFFQLYSRYAWRAAAALAIFGLIFFFTRDRLEENIVSNESIKQEMPVSKRSKFPISQPSGKIKLAQSETRVKNNSKQKNESDKKKKFSTEIPLMKIIIHIERIEQKGINNIGINKEVILQKKLPAHKLIVFDPILNINEIKQEDGFKGLLQLAEEKIQNSTMEVLVEQNKPDSLKNIFSFSDLGLLFVKLYNETTGDNAKVMKSYDNSGNVVGYGIVANNFQFSTGK